MVPAGKVLVPTDFSNCARQALRYALAVGRKSASRMHLVHVVTPIETDPYGPIHHLPEVDAAHEGVEKLIHDLLVDELQAAGASEDEVEPVEVHGKTAALGVLDYAREIDADLIVMGTHGRRGLRHFLMGSVAEECVRRARIPVLTIRDCHDRPEQPVRFRRILVGIDFSEFSRPLLQKAVETARAYESELDLLFAVEPLPFPIAFSGMLTLRDLVPSIRVNALRHLEELANEVDLDSLRHRLHVIDGDAAEAIVTFADSHEPDLVMLATEARSAGERFLIGSVTERVVRASPAPVYVMKLTASSAVEDGPTPAGEETSKET